MFVLGVGSRSTVQPMCALVPGLQGKEPPCYPVLIVFSFHAWIYVYLDEAPEQKFTRPTPLLFVPIGAGAAKT